MKTKTKVFLNSPRLLWMMHRAKRIAKKIQKLDDTERYPLQWRQDFVLKRAKKAFKMFNINLTVKGYENVPKNVSLIVPNHSSSLDAGFIIVALENQSQESDQVNPKTVFLAKEELKKKNKFYGFFKILNTFFIDRKNPRQALGKISEMIDYAKTNKTHMVIFAEGTRSLDGSLLPFKGGSFKIAKQAFIPIVPVTINNALSATDFSRTKKLNVEVIFHRPIKPMEFISSDTNAIGENVRRIVESSWKKPQGQRGDNEKKYAG